jgi:hypothetical protein
VSRRVLAAAFAFVLVTACGDDFGPTDRVGVEVYNASQQDVVVSFEPAFDPGRLIWLAVPARSQVGALIGERARFGGRVSVFTSSCTPQAEVDAVVSDQTLHMVIDDAGRLLSVGEQEPGVSGLTRRDAQAEDLYLSTGDERVCDG